METETIDRQHQHKPKRIASGATAPDVEVDFTRCSSRRPFVDNIFVVHNAVDVTPAEPDRAADANRRQRSCD
ncbi:hypothetical protein GALL_304270 [mine drainage metagenome]|uniref:Uncharacterized protein n=1 Tax=mine drainage metagenome TaxID=410659 RepID=A0A1J5QWR4_9ZZZZ